MPIVKLNFQNEGKPKVLFITRNDRQIFCIDGDVYEQDSVVKNKGWIAINPTNIDRIVHKILLNCL